MKEIQEEDRLFLEGYIEHYRRGLIENEEVFQQICEFRDLALELRESGRKFMVAGNGASASIASHVSVDLTKQGQTRAVNFNEANLLTCFGNDYGYENWVVEAVKAYGDEGDVLVLISSSGTSKNVVNAANYAKDIGMKVVSFSGFAPDNPLRTAADIAFWVESRSYNVIESIHMTWATMAIDLLIGEIEYGVS